MPVVYSAVARGQVVLAEYAVIAGNFSAVARDCLAKASGGQRAGGTAPSSASAAAPAAPARWTFATDGHLFSFLGPDQDGFTFVVVADEASTGRALPAALLDKIRAQWAAKGYPDKLRQQQQPLSPQKPGTHQTQQPSQQPPPQLQPAFQRSLKEAVEDATQFPERYGRVAAVQARVEEVKAVMGDNIDRVMARGEKLELLVDKTEGLALEADRFVRGGRQLRRRMRCENLKSKATMAAVLVLVLAVLFLLVCFMGGRNCMARGGGGEGGGGGGGNEAARAPAVPPPPPAAAAPPADPSAPAPGNK